MFIFGACWYDMGSMEHCSHHIQIVTKIQLGCVVVADISTRYREGVSCMLARFGGDLAEDRCGFVGVVLCRRCLLDLLL